MSHDEKSVGGRTVSGHAEQSENNVAALPGSARVGDYRRERGRRIKSVPRIMLEDCRARLAAARSVIDQSIANRQPLTLDAARDAISYADSYTRMIILQELAYLLSAEDWQRMLGEEWTRCDNIGLHRRTLKKMLPERGPVAAMMNRDELAAWHALPEVVTVYRGCGARNMTGASWSLDRGVAAKFPFVARYRAEPPLLVTARVSRHHVLALKLDRNEQEVVTFHARRVAIDLLPPVVAQEVAQ